MATVTITFVVDPSVGGTVNKTTKEYTVGSEILIKATPARNYSFVRWTGGGTFSDNYITSTIYTVPSSNATVVAHFELQPVYTASIRTTTGGTVSSNYTTGAQGEKINLTATPSAGYTFAGWTASTGTLMSTTTTSTTFTFDSSNTGITAHFNDESDVPSGDIEWVTDEGTLTLNCNMVKNSTDTPAQIKLLLGVVR